jgi:hypothetical protein
MEYLERKEKVCTLNDFMLIKILSKGIPLVAVAILLVLPYAMHAQARFVAPISGAYAKDYILVNYVDWVVDTFIGDHYCNTKTYDGHQGTDFVIRNFRAMDSGVDVRAADNGRVIFIKDGLFDREKVSVVSKLLGNYIGITHSGKLQTYYGHLRKGSVLVKVGDSVIAGQKIAQVGSSGNSSDPHLHFELWYDSSYYIDPFSGPCGNATSYWKLEPPFDTSFGIWASGMCNYVCNLDTLKEEPLRQDTFYSKDPVITYWNLQYGLRKNDSLRIDWYTPSGLLWLSYGFRVTQDLWYYYFWSYIATPTGGAEGKWAIKYYRNNALAAERPFYFYKKSSEISSFTITKDDDWLLLYQDKQIILKGIDAGDELYIYDVQGRMIKKEIAIGQEININTAEWTKGMYIITKSSRQNGWSRRKMIVW